MRGIAVDASTWVALIVQGALDGTCRLVIAGIWGATKAHIAQTLVDSAINTFTTNIGDRAKVITQVAGTVTRELM